MRINADFSQPATLMAADQEWIHSPEHGVDRIMLDRIGDEVARATSIVRYGPHSSFPRHEHALGEEYLVLSGVFSDEHGDYPTGTYVRNPPGSSHSPFSEGGCEILVKLRQFEPTDLHPVVVNTTDASVWPSVMEQRLATLVLHQFEAEKVQMLRLPKGCSYATKANNGGVELLVVSGLVEYEQQMLDVSTWLRLPSASDLQLTAREESMVWIKSGHLPAA